MASSERYVAVLESLTNQDVERVGGKNASLGEMLQHLGKEGVRVPGGFATTVEAYWTFLDAASLRGPIADHIAAYRSGKRPLREVGKAIRELILGAEIPDEVAEAIRRGYRDLADRLQIPEPQVAVRSSATAEDLPEASFAGQQETYLNIRGPDALLDACRRCFASLFTNRAIVYRENNHIEHDRVALSVGVQHMVRSDKAGAGVMFSIDTETGFPKTVVINANWGLGETVVQGNADPDEYTVFKPLLANPDCVPIVNRKLGNKEQKMVYAEGEHPTRLVETSPGEQHRFVLTEEEILELARWAVAAEKHYGKPMDMEWAKDGITGELYMVQARPETVQSRKQAGVMQSFRIKEHGEEILRGLAIGAGVAVGKVCRLDAPDQSDQFEDGSVLVTGMTDPDWVPLMKRAAAIVTDHGGRTSHAAIVSRELGLPAIVGTGRATEKLEGGREITVSCAEGDQGIVYDGIADYEADDISIEDIPETRTRVMVNMAEPGAASRWWRLPAKGVGLARMEFVINNMVKIHPMALVRWDEVKDEKVREEIEALTAGWDDKPAYFVDNLAYGIARIAAVFYPEPVIVRLSDFKSNEYAQLIGGRPFEPREENPMLGWRGASRYYSEGYRDGFALECRAIRQVRERMGLDNVVVMIPFCRTLEEADRVIEVMNENGLVRGVRGLELYVMCEIPSNVILAEQFAERFDGFSIGSNDLTQLTLGVDRDSDLLSHLFDERNEAVTSLIEQVIDSAHRRGRKVGLCGQAPSDHPDFADFLVKAGIDSISVDPSAFVQVKAQVARSEKGD